MLDFLATHRVRPESRLHGRHDRIVDPEGELDIPAQVVQQILLGLRIDPRITTLLFGLELLAQLHHVLEEFLVFNLLLEIVGQQTIDAFGELAELSRIRLALAEDIPAHGADGF